MPKRNEVTDNISIAGEGLEMLPEVPREFQSIEANEVFAADGWPRIEAQARVAAVARPSQLRTIIEFDDAKAQIERLPVTFMDEIKIHAGRP
jgi:hypothetical protein